jgi:hypothetical protein
VPENQGVKMKNPFSELKTNKDILNVLRKAHLALVDIDPSYMPDEVYSKKVEYERILLQFIVLYQKQIGEVRR